MASHNLAIIGSSNGLLPLCRQAITGTDTDLLPIKPPTTNFIKIWIKYLFSFKKPLLKISAKCRPFWSGHHYLTHWRCHMTTEICVNIGSGNGLMPDGTKPLPGPTLTSLQWDPLAFTWGTLWRNRFRYCSSQSVWKCCYTSQGPLS